MSCAPAFSTGWGRRPWRLPAWWKPSANGLAVVGLRPPLNNFMPARLRLAAAGRSRSSSLLPASPASATRPGSEWSCKINPRSCRCATECRSGPCGPRQPTPGRRFTGPQASCDPVPAAMKTGNDSGEHAVKIPVWLTQGKRNEADKKSHVLAAERGDTHRGGSVSGAEKARRGKKLRSGKCVRKNRP